MPPSTGVLSPEILGDAIRRHTLQRKRNNNARRGLGMIRSYPALGIIALQFDCALSGEREYRLGSYARSSGT